MGPPGREGRGHGRNARMSRACLSLYVCVCVRRFPVLARARARWGARAAGVWPRRGLRARVTAGGRSSAWCAWPVGRWAGPVLWGGAGGSGPLPGPGLRGGAALAWGPASPDSGVTACEAFPRPNGPPLRAVASAGQGLGGGLRENSCCFVSERPPRLAPVALGLAKAIT